MTSPAEMGRPIVKGMSREEVEHLRYRVKQLSRVNEKTSCVEWVGYISRRGYGLLPLKGSQYRAHRVSWEVFNGPIKKGLSLDHLCRNARCINTQHLEPVSHKENLRRGSSPIGINARKTSCIRGHPFSGDNLIHMTRGPQKRACRECLKIAYDRKKMERMMKKNN